MTTAVMPMVETTLGSQQLPAGQRKVLVQGGLLKTTNGVYKQVRDN